MGKSCCFSWTLNAGHLNVSNLLLSYVWHYLIFKFYIISTEFSSLRQEMNKILTNYIKDRLFPLVCDQNMLLRLLRSCARHTKLVDSSQTETEADSLDTTHSIFNNPSQGSHFWGWTTVVWIWVYVTTTFLKHLFIYFMFCILFFFPQEVGFKLCTQPSSFSLLVILTNYSIVTKLA